MPPDDLLQCQTNGGDCLITLAERREQLVRTDYLHDCRDPEALIQGPCIVKELEQRGNVPDLVSYLETENWCSRKLLDCATALASDAAHLAVRQRTQARREQVQTAPASVVAERAPEFAKEKLAFLRSTLPPNAQQACASAAPLHCPETHSLPSSQFEAELAKDGPSYDAKRALGLYAAIQQAEADCSAPELTCLKALLPQYGGTPASAKLLEQNLQLIAKQQSARLEVDADAAEQCLSDGVIQHRDRIVSAYRAYVREPAAAPFALVQKAFVGLHEDELRCLLRLKRPGKR